jgi:hypothetical protein
MGDDHSAHLVYGYDLGNNEDHAIEEVDSYGLIDLPWVERDEDGWLDEDLVSALTRKLYESIPDADPARAGGYGQDDLIKSTYGVEILEHGWLVEGDTPSYALIAYQVKGDGGDAEPVDLDKLQGMVSVLKPKLSQALSILGITPRQKQPSWLLLATR